MSKPEPVSNVRPPPEMKHIQRARERAWRVFFYRSNRSLRINKYFSDSAFGGAEAALEAAKQWRDAMMAENPRATKTELAVMVRKHNVSGVAGVCRLKQHLKTASGHLQPYFIWQAQSLRGIKPLRTRSFSVLKYGEDGAKRLAIAARKAFEAEQS